MAPSGLWNLHLKLVSHGFLANRASFTHRTQTCEEWVWLALEQGRFEFHIGRGETASTGFCGAGEWVLCHPGEPLRRTMLDPCSFHFALFESDCLELEGLCGLNSPRDLARQRANFAALRVAPDNPHTAGWKAHLIRDSLLTVAWERETTPSPGTLDPAMERVRDWLEAHLNHKISYAALAAEHRLTPSAFSKRFCAAIGASPQAFTVGKRLELARRLLMETDLTLDAIATQCGYGNGFHLSRAWSQAYGLPPARFRRTHRP